MRFEGWRLTGFIAAGLAVFLVVTLFWYGLNEDGVRVWVRNSARSSVILFLLAFSASSLQRLLRQRWSEWLLRNRRYIGVSFAVSHFYHLLGLISLALWFPQPFFDELGWPFLAAGSLGYAFIAAMTATSFDKSRARLGERGWQYLHMAGAHYLWLIFAVSYFMRAFEDSFYIPFAALVTLAMLLRIAAWRFRK